MKPVKVGGPHSPLKYIKPSYPSVPLRQVRGHNSWKTNKENIQKEKERNKNKEKTTYKCKWKKPKSQQIIMIRHCDRLQDPLK